MLKTMLCVGVTLTCGSAAVGYDYTIKAQMTPGEVLSLSDYLADLDLDNLNLPDLNFGVVDLMAKEPQPRIASLPQVGIGLAGPDMNAPAQTTEEQIDEFVEGNPQLQAMVARDRAEAKTRWWDRLFRKAETNEAPRTNRLAAIRERNFPLPVTPRPGLDPNALNGMSALELYSNRGAISQGFTNTVINGMNAASDSGF